MGLSARFMDCLLCHVSWAWLNVGSPDNPWTCVRSLWVIRRSGVWVFRWCPTLPLPGGGSTIGVGGLSFRVRYGSGRFPAPLWPPGRWWGCGVLGWPPVGGGGWVGSGLRSGRGVGWCVFLLFPPSCFPPFLFGCSFGVVPLWVGPLGSPLWGCPFGVALVGCSFGVAVFVGGVGVCVGCVRVGRLVPVG